MKLVQKYPESTLTIPSLNVPVAFIATVAIANAGLIHAYCKMPLLMLRKVCGGV